MSKPAAPQELDLAQFVGHTPGPLFVIDRADGLPIYVCADPADRFGTEVAVIYTERASGAPNARLIASAPDLLAECRALRAELARLKGEK